MNEARTGIVLLLDEHAPELAAARYELDPAARSRVPLHVTLLFPWLPLARLRDEDVDGLRAFVAARPRPAFELARVAVFDGGYAYAAPEPPGELTRLMRDLWDRYPETPAYGGGHDEPVPHATLAPLGLHSVEAVRRRVDALLPVRCEPEHVSLIEEHEPDRFRERAALPFGAAA